MKKNVNMSLSYDTTERLDQYAFENHLSRSGAVTDLVWKARVKYEQVRGQMTMDEILKSQEHAGRKNERRSSK